MARAEHFVLTIGYALFFVIHIVQVILAGWNNFRSVVSGFEVIKEEQVNSKTGEDEKSIS
jgi:thiosulfate reductase cytochrome b subunit